MEITPSRTCESLKTAWRRRKYQRLHGATSSNKSELKITRPGNVANASELKPIPKLSLKMASPIRLLTKFHNTYVDMMMRLVNNMGKANQGGVFRGKKVAKDPHIVSMVSGGDQVIDTRLVLEIYKRLAASPELRELVLEFEPN